MQTRGSISLYHLLNSQQFDLLWYWNSQCRPLDSNVLYLQKFFTLNMELQYQQKMNA